jgi:hypothetical protein
VVGWRAPALEAQGLPGAALPDRWGPTGQPRTQTTRPARPGALLCGPHGKTSFSAGCGVRTRGRVAEAYESR